MKKKRILSFVIALALLVPATFSALTESGLTAVAKSDYSVTVGNVRVQTLTDTLARIELKGPNGFEDRETYHIVKRDYEGISSTVQTTEQVTKIITEQYTVYVPNNAKSLSGIYITDKQDHTIWEYTSLPSGTAMFPDPGDIPKAWEIADNPRVVPAEWGYSPMPEENTQHKEYNGWDSTNNAPDLYIFMPNGDYRTLSKDFITLTGPSEMLPLKALGLWHSRYYDYKQDEALALIDKYRAEGFPLDNFVVDTDWRVNASTGYDINTGSWPDMQKFFNDAHTQKHVNIIFNDHPEPVNDQHALSQQDLIYRNQNLNRLLDMGLDSWWFDRNWRTTIKTPFEGINKESFGMYLYQDITKSHDPSKRPMILGNYDGIDNGRFNRAPDIASHRFSLQWTGDTFGTEEYLKMDIANTVLAGTLTSMPYLSTDVGGHNLAVSPDFWTRWSQFAAFSPIFRYHCTAGDNLDRSPWLYGDTAQSVAKEYIDMRYRLLPLFYSLSHESYETGLPINRRLDINYGKYFEAKDNTQYLLGDNILVAPIWEADGSLNAVPPDFFKDGVHAEYYNNTTLSGQPVLTRKEENINFNWGESSPDSSVNVNNFSARFTGKITPSEDITLAMNCDDGIRLYINGALVRDEWKPNDNQTYHVDKVLKKGISYTIMLEYYEGEGNALVGLKYQPYSEEVLTNTRTVFIPDGRWIDVWSGTEYVGPKTITVTHGIETTPLFVRSGTIIPLAENMNYIGEKPWDNITLDVYPSTQLKGSSELYEDDGISVEYKNGNYRKTPLETSFDKSSGEFIVKIGKAEGTFNGSDAFDKREWKVRVHVPSGWGNLQSFSLDNTDKKAQVTKISKVTDASPFALSGGALDGDIYELTFEKPLSQESVVRLKLSNPQNEPIPDGKDLSEVTWSPVLEDSPAKVNLSDENLIDWVHVGLNRNPAALNRKNTANKILSAPQVTGNAMDVSDYFSQISWSDGTPTVSAQDSKNAIAMQNSVQITVPSSSNWRELKIYMGVWQGENIIEIDDETRSKSTTMKFSAGSTANTKCLTIRFRSDTETQLRVKWSAKTESGGNVSLAAYSLSEEFSDVNKQGDIDGDKQVDVSDVVALRSVIMSGKSTAAQLEAGDFDGDQSLTVTDVVALRSYIMKGVK